MKEGLAWNIFRGRAFSINNVLVLFVQPGAQVL